MRLTRQWIRCSPRLDMTDHGIQAEKEFAS